MNHQTPPPATAIGILGTGRHLPAGVRSNEQVAAAAGVSPEWIVERTGILRRHQAADHEAASDLAAAAVRDAAEAAGTDPAGLGLIVCATSTPDELGPSTACRVQSLLGAADAVALDVSAACSGWLFAAKVAHDWLRHEQRPRPAAVVGVEVYSKFLDPADRGTSVLFADGAAATILGPVPEPGGFHDFRLGSDGDLADQVLIPAGGSRNPASGRTVADGGHRVHMDGRAVSRFIREIFPRLVDDSLHRNGLALDDIDHLIAHQPNPLLLRNLAAGLGIDADRMPIVGDEVGNIGAAGAPYALATAHARGLLRPGDRILITVFGAGMTWGSALLHWTAPPAPAHREGQPA